MHSWLASFDAHCDCNHQLPTEDLFQMLQHDEEESMDVIGRFSRPQTPDVGRAGEEVDRGISPAQIGRGGFDDTYASHHLLASVFRGILCYAITL